MSLSNDDWQNIVSFSHLLLKASHDGTEQCAEEILELLMSFFNLKACSFYSYFEKTKKLTLRAQKGLDYKKYKSFYLPLDSTAGSALKKESVLFFEDLHCCDDYIDKVLVKEFGLKNMVVIPINNPDSICQFEEVIRQKYLGVICAYFNEYIDIETEKHIFNILSKLIGSAYTYAVNVDRLRLRQDVVNNSISASDLNSFLFKTLQMMRKNWNIEASSIFLEDERNGLLRLHATTGVQSEKKRVEIFYLPNENNFTVKAFINNEIIALSYPETEELKCRYKEIIQSGKIKSAIFLPIIEPPHPYVEKRRILGVLRVVNRKIERDGVIEYGFFGWEDLALVVFISEVIGIISFLYQRNQKIIENYSRSMHGVRNNIKAVKANLDFFMRHNDDLNAFSNEMRYMVTDSISFMEALKWQIEKNDLRFDYSDISITDIKLMGDVLSKIVVFLKSSYRAYNVVSLNINNLISSGFKELPMIKGNVEALQVVFRNLAENSMKYCNRKFKCIVNISWEIHTEYIKISFKDFGLGIKEDEVDRLFVEGYRSEEAMRRDPLGTGLGLAHSKAIMKNMGGDLYLGEYKKYTEFIIEIKKTI